MWTTKPVLQKEVFILFMSHKMTEMQRNPPGEYMGEGLLVEPCFGGWAMGLELCLPISPGKNSSTSAQLGKRCCGI